MKEFKKQLIWSGIIVLLFTFEDVSAIVLEIAGYMLLGIVVLACCAMIFVFSSAGITRRKLARFKKKNEGNYFLLYSSNKRLKEPIEKELRPLLDISHELIYVNREQMVTKLSDDEWRYLLIETNTIKFPRLIKIKAGKVLAESFYCEVRMFGQLELSKEVFKKQVITKLNKLKNE